MKTKVVIICIGIIFLIIPKISLGQNVYTLNDSLKSLYNNEYLTVTYLLKSLVDKNYCNVFEKIENGSLDKKKYYQSYKEMREKLLYSGLPNDSCITIRYNNKAINDLVYDGEIMLKNVIFEISIKDPEIKDFKNVITFEFFTDKEKGFEKKTHDYKLNKMYFTSASWYESRANFIDALMNLNLDSIMNERKNNLR
ncbi:MAG: hypothetical protein ACOCWG_01285 [bacterium]